MNFRVYCDGELVNEGNNEVLKVGAGYYGEEFEKALIGVELDKEYEFEITVPKNDENKEYAGKTETIIAKVTKIQYMQECVLDKKFVEENYGLQSVDAYYEYVEEVKYNHEELNIIKDKYDSIMEIRVEDIQCQRLMLVF